MKKRLVGLAMALTIGLAGCSAVDKGITVQPYELNEMEEELVTRTQVDFIEYFTLNGKTDGLDLKHSVEVYEKGKLVDELLQSQGIIEEAYQNEIISFGLQKHKDMELFLTTNGSSASTEYEGLDDEEQGGSSYGTLLDKKVKLVKDEPVYLAVWAGTTGEIIASINSEGGKLPENLDSYDRAFLFKMELVDHDPEFD